MVGESVSVAAGNLDPVASLRFGYSHPAADITEANVGQTELPSDLAGWPSPYQLKQLFSF
jgi:hypothetical protein